MSENLGRRLTENRARLRRPQFETALSKALDDPRARFEYLSRAETEELRQIFFATVFAGGEHVRQFATCDAMLLDVTAESRGAPLPKQVWLFHYDDAILGAVSVEPRRLLANARAVWRVVRDGLNFCIDDATSGASLDSDHEGRVETWTAVTWGAFAGS